MILKGTLSNSQAPRCLETAASSRRQRPQNHFSSRIFTAASPAAYLYFCTIDCDQMAANVRYFDHMRMCRQWCDGQAGRQILQFEYVPREGILA
jgi:hypothetical protein